MPVEIVKRESLSNRRRKNRCQSGRRSSVLFLWWIILRGDAMSKINCWEFMKCGRQPGGKKVSERGVCPAATESRTDGMNSGSMGGRACWAITGTFCDGTVQGEFALKMSGCIHCEFYRRVAYEEGLGYHGAREILDRLK